MSKRKIIYIIATVIMYTAEIWTFLSYKTKSLFTYVLFINLPV